MQQARQIIVLLVLLMWPSALGAAALRGDETPRAFKEVVTVPAPSAPSPQEALRIWKRLHESFQRIYWERDPTLVPRYLSEDGPMFPVAVAEVAQLRSDKVRSRTRFLTRRAEVVESNPRSFVVEHRLALYPVFLNRAGEDITKSEPLIQRIHWTVVLRSGRWYLHRCWILKSREKDGGAAWSVD